MLRVIPLGATGLLTTRVFANGSKPVKCAPEPTDTLASAVRHHIIGIVAVITT
jgi:hypothetical protein